MRVSASEQPVSHCRGKPKHCLPLFYQRAKLVSFREGNQAMTYKRYFFPHRKERDDLLDASAVASAWRPASETGRVPQPSHGSGSPHHPCR